MFTTLLKNKLVFPFVILVILILATFLRLYKLDTNPPSLSWDEAAVGYNAYSIANFGKDEWGKTFPLYFKSFEDDKHPVHIYFTALSVKLLGLNEFSTRLPAAIFGVLNVLMIYFLAKELFAKLPGLAGQIIGIFTAFLLAISPYSLQFSRFNHELQFALFFFVCGLYFFLVGLRQKNILLSLSFLFFGIDLFTYHSAKVVLPLVLICLFIIYFNELKKVKTFIGIGFLIFSFFIFLMIKNPALLGLARINQTSFPKELVSKTFTYQATKNELLGRLEITASQYILHLSPEYLFLQGDKNARHSTHLIGEFYVIEALFLFVGLLRIMIERSKYQILLLCWALIAPLPSSMVMEAPHAARALFMLGSWSLISGLGAFTIINLPKRMLQKISLGLVFLGALIILFGIYIKGYYNTYPKQYAIDWQYGMKQIVNFVSDNPRFRLVYMTDARSQPYIFFVYYLKTPTPTFIRGRDINTSALNHSYNLVAYFDKYFFGGWDPLMSSANPDVLYILTPSQYNGLRDRLAFEVLKKIDYPNELDAFYLVSAK
ncbi:hypothetical protein A2631_02935 [Candidatus Daviesbacteria bacterium RIFCSPHIGHO2_01_FULL_44_29]|uniref:Glycosyltransferase RgtA/B/C/D-like domain-containing protein n=1 Tax=Candidatus Daviesbacteria bacterium RIFCSPHIGHO2_02_FULL_43_12 TaxID=1797776 RepID=A0A1F5KKI4_9BACT|nr:MAG: hypothetical protein A2631_02935 [Candidatus Daviesbacteria bacterium RIFCSPHIGHO2_01_FULL_44_29]OGE40808.1 MAG: hypothetical protein A3E86_02415 [Candidatus Daviesbacteria bacterium RIFCSPHIGHO2_12_FULL_47_45]OGE41339.1 MAG: hypothetical protein A3D25_02330 [Candidatus Daviesbacteria bacterium RIFCSPHIGHO2_02_FULL_43_12]OGE69540.1 MAG: hypothetical protein A3B55_04070 [Candidatus Daviesbacteria bacterium RIFCSPLOWO2_01_FULL_43_15]